MTDQTRRIESFPDEYGEILCWVRDCGEWTAPRGEDTLEVLGAQLVIEDTTCTLPIATGRKCKVSLADTEALELVSGTHDPDNQRFNPTSGFVNDPNLECYGPLTKAAIERSIAVLTDDRDSRRAVANLGHVGDDSPYPCLASLGWVIRKGSLHGFVDFRSNDAWLGMPYDVHACAALLRSMAWTLEVKPGRLYYRARSLHLYDRHLGLIDAVSTPDRYRATTMVRGNTWLDAQIDAERALQAMKADEQ